MPILNRAAELQQEVTGWRRHLHSMPELGFGVDETAAFVADKLRVFGCDEVVTGVGRTGVVGLICGRAGGHTVGLRADMDALPICEETGLPWASKIPGRMHACGHDGHTAMLLGAAKYLAETRNFAGRVAVIFQPAEEDGGGGNEMVRDGLMERFGISRVFGMHSAPGLPVGHFALRPGPIMAETLEFVITVEGKGGHAARPHGTIDPIVIGSQIVSTLQTIVSRSVDPLDSLVVSVTKFQAGAALNIIAGKAELAGTVRSLRKEVTAAGRERIWTICKAQAAAMGGHAEIEFIPSYPVTFNHAAETVLAGSVASRVAGAANVDTNAAPEMFGEDFSYMLEARPGAYIFLGNGDSTGLHNPAYDFNDEAIPYGISYWVQLAETA
ncbi:MAG TPA: M20 aminoacylase family protein [Lichenihabitans sp.]|jgi:hippurate hydrolase|nr:M20 aminoacylase family protein [Lichenihabitans sp.]